MRISDWSSDVCSSDLIAGGLSLHDFSADGKAIDAVAPQQLIEGVRAVHEFTALAQAGSCHCSTSRDPPSRQADRKSVVKGQSVSVRVDLGGRRIIKKKNKTDAHNKLLVNDI